MKLTHFKQEQVKESVKHLHSVLILLALPNMWDITQKSGPPQ